jgi:hypothetical protein
MAIMPNTTNRNLTDRVFIANAGLTPRAAIIKLKLSGANHRMAAA